MYTLTVAVCGTSMWASWGINSWFGWAGMLQGGGAGPFWGPSICWPMGEWIKEHCFKHDWPRSQKTDKFLLTKFLTNDRSLYLREWRWLTMVQTEIVKILIHHEKSLKWQDGCIADQCNKQNSENQFSTRLLTPACSYPIGQGPNLHYPLLIWQLDQWESLKYNRMAPV